MFQLCRIFKKKNNTAKKRAINTDNPPNYDDVHAEKCNDIIYDMRTNPVKYIDYGYKKFLEKMTNEYVQKLRNDKRVYYISVTEWYNEPNSKYWENKTHTSYITHILCEYIKSYLKKEHQFVTSSNVWCDHPHLRGKKAYDDIILFGHKYCFSGGNIDKYVECVFGPDGEFWHDDGHFVGMGIVRINLCDGVKYDI